MQEERPPRITQKNVDGFEAVIQLKLLFKLSQMAYVIAIQKYGICNDDLMRQTDRSNSPNRKDGGPTRKQMAQYIDAVMGLDPKFAHLAGQELEIIKYLLEIE